MVREVKIPKTAKEMCEELKEYGEIQIRQEANSYIDAIKEWNGQKTFMPDYRFSVEGRDGKYFSIYQQNEWISSQLKSNEKLYNLLIKLGYKITFEQKDLVIEVEEVKVRKEHSFLGFKFKGKVIRKYYQPVTMKTFTIATLSACCGEDENKPAPSEGHGEGR